MKNLRIIFSVIIGLSVIVFLISRQLDQQKDFITQTEQLDKLKFLLNSNYVAITFLPTNSKKSLVSEKTELQTGPAKSNLISHLKNSSSYTYGKGHFSAVDWETILKIENREDSIFLKIVDNTVYPLFVIKKDGIYDNELMFGCENLTNVIESLN